MSPARFPTTGRRPGFAPFSARDAHRRHSSERRAMPGHASARRSVRRRPLLRSCPARPPRHRPAVAAVGGSELRLLPRVGTADPESLDDYRATEDIAASPSHGARPDRVAPELVASDLLGRGGAAFPTGRKWRPSRTHRPARTISSVMPTNRSRARLKIACLWKQDPFAIVEAMTIAAHAIGCERAFIYIRGEYPLATQRLAGAIAQARGAGLLGEDVMGCGERASISRFVAAQALISAAKRPRSSIRSRASAASRATKPPFPVEAGLFGKPTLVNNVETLVNLPLILTEGATAYARVGTPSSTGTRLFCLSGSARARRDSTKCRTGRPSGR